MTSGVPAYSRSPERGGRSAIATMTLDDRTGLTAAMTGAETESTWAPLPSTRPASAPTSSRLRMPAAPFDAADERPDVVPLLGVRRDHRRTHGDTRAERLGNQVGTIEQKP